MSDRMPRFTIDCKGCGRTGTTTSVHELFTVQYCPDCQRLREQATNQENGGQP